MRRGFLALGIAVFGFAPARAQPFYGDSGFYGADTLRAFEYRHQLALQQQAYERALQWQQGGHAQQQGVAMQWQKGRNAQQQGVAMQWQKGRNAQQQGVARGIAGRR